MTAAVSKTKLVRPLRGGQVTIPVEFRRSLGIDKDTMLSMTLTDGELVVRPIKFTQKDQKEGDSPWLRELYEYFAPVRDEILRRGISEEEVNAASLQYVRKITGFNRPSRANEAAFQAAVEDVARISGRLLASLETAAPPKDREEEAAKAKARSAQRFGG